MLEQNKKIWFNIISIFFILLNSVFIIMENYTLLIAPIVLLFAYLVFFKLDTLLKIIIFFVPLSIELIEFKPGISFSMALPTEPILFGVLLIFILRLFYDGGFDKRILKHPVSYAILFYLSWTFITVLTSTHPMVSAKFLLGQLWFIATFYFIATQFFRNQKNMNQFFWLYCSGFSFVLVYTIIMHYGRGFDQETANWIMSPFFNDHTSYGAAIAFFLPFLTGKLFSNKIIGTKKLLLFLFYALFITALVLSYTRAAWISLIGALGIYFILKLKIKGWIIFSVGIVVAITLAFSWNQIMLSLESNKQDSSTNLKEHVSSISNVSSDASNLERINRWKSAFEMFKEKPLLGWGPGVYAFEYAPFQKSSDKTIISTNSGDAGTAHSEYLGPLAESGVLGFVAIITIVTTTLFTGIRVYKKLPDGELRVIAISAVLGLITYYIHGGLNNFLDTDKISAPFWCFTAIIVVLDVYYVKNLKPDTQNFINSKT